MTSTSGDKDKLIENLRELMDKQQSELTQKCETITTLRKDSAEKQTRTDTNILNNQ